MTDELVKLVVLDPDTILLEEGEQAESLYVILAGQVDIRRKLAENDETRKQFRLAHNTGELLGTHANVNMGTYGELIKEKCYEINDWDKSILGIETIQPKDSTLRSPYTFITSRYQTQNCGKVLALKIDPEQFHDQNLARDFCRRLLVRQRDFYQNIGTTQKAVSKGLSKMLDFDIIKGKLRTDMLSQTQAKETYPKLTIAAQK